MGRTRSHRMHLAALVTGLALALSGCSSVPWATPTPTSTPTPTVSEVPQPAPNDLSTGATERSLAAGPLTASINYWSTLSMDKWAPGALKPISLSMITTITPDDGQKVYLQRASMIATPGSNSETFESLAPQVDTATTSPGYLVLSPYSYSQTFNVGPTPEGATFVTVELTYEYLVQATPTSADYAKQTATDSLTIALTP